MFETTVCRLRAVALVVGVPSLILLGIAMPLKYLAGMPQAVTLAAWLHGLLFMAFCIALTQAHQECRWTLARSGTVLLAALLPFGPFVIDARLRREEEVIQRRSR